MHLIVPIIILMIWQISAGLMGQHFFPTPLKLISTLSFDLAYELLIDLFFSIKRFLIGNTLGISAAILSGSILALNETLRKLFLPTFNGARSIPVIALFPVIILVFGMNEYAAIFILTWIAFIPTFIATVDAVSVANTQHADFINEYSLTMFEKITKLLLPSALPSILSGIDLSLNLTFKFLILAELFGIQNGIGYKLSYSADYLNYNKVYIIVVVIAITGIIISFTFNKFSDYIIKSKLRITA